MFTRHSFAIPSCGVVSPYPISYASVDNPANDAAAAAARHAELEPGQTLGAPAAGAGAGQPEKRKGGRPKLPPGVKGTYKRRAIPKGKPAAKRAARSGRKGAAAPVHPEEGDRAPAAQDAAIERRRQQRGQNGGWLKVGGWGEKQGGRTPSVLREKAREVLAELGYPELANIIVDPDAKDADKLRAVDILAKMAVGYMTPELAMGEDAPDLPPPIFNTTSGALPGEEGGPPDQFAVADPNRVDPDGMMPGESRGLPADGVLNFPQAGPVHTLEPEQEVSGPVPFFGAR